MHIYSPSKKPWPAILAALVITLLLDQCWVAPQAPEWSRAVGINAGIVFLDCPVDLPFPFGLPALVIFFLVYMFLVFPYPSLIKGGAWRQARRQARTVTLALSIIPLCILAGGLAYFFAHDHLSRAVRNAIESLGINADLYTAYPGHEIIHLRGGMVMLACFFVGLQLCKRKIRKALNVAGMNSPIDINSPIPMDPILDTQICTYTDPTQAPSPVRSKPERQRTPARLAQPIPEIRRSVHDLYRETSPASLPDLPNTLPQRAPAVQEKAGSFPDTPRSLPKRVHVILPNSRSY